jgi:hypothetical protein
VTVWRRDCEEKMRVRNQGRDNGLNQVAGSGDGFYIWSRTEKDLLMDCM